MRNCRSLVLFFLACTCALALGGEPGGEPTVKFRFVAVSDTHIAAPEHLAKFRNFLYTIKKKIAPEFLIMLGDNCGQAPEFLPLIREVALQSGLEVRPVPGNHDDDYARHIEWYRPVFGRMFYSFDYKGWHFVMNWSQKLPMDWLNADLAQVPPGTPVVLCQHYSPMMPGLSMDQIVKQEPWATLLKRTGPKLWLTGHLHDKRIEKIQDANAHTLNQWFYFDEKDVGEYAVVEALSDGTARVEHIPMNTLTLEEPPDKLPEVAITAPLNGSTLTAPTTFTGTASDDKGILWVSYQIDRGAWMPVKGTTEWTFTLNPTDLSQGPHLVSVRAFDSSGQGTIFIKPLLISVEAPRSPGQIVLQQGLNGYGGCTDATVRFQTQPKNPDGTEGSAEDLESWFYMVKPKNGAAKLEEYSEFYLRFDFAGTKLKPGAKVKSAKLALYCSRQNHNDGQRCKYGVGVMEMPWKPDMTFATRPAKPGWLAAENPASKPVIEGIWPYTGGAQMIWPPKPVEIDLAGIKDAIQQWVDKPETNHGLVFSPLFGKTHNMSFQSSRCKYPSLRPQLVIELEQ